MHIAQCLLDARAKLKRVNISLISRSWQHRIMRDWILKLRIGTKQPLHVERKIFLHVYTGSLYVEIWFGVILKLAVSMLFDVLFIDQFIRRIFLFERKIFPWHFHLLANLSTK